MTLTIITLIILFAIVCADFSLWLRYGKQATISGFVERISPAFPIVPFMIGFAFGFLTAHWFF